MAHTCLFSKLGIFHLMLFWHFGCWLKVWDNSALGPLCVSGGISHAAFQIPSLLVFWHPDYNISWSISSLILSVWSSIHILNLDVCLQYIGEFSALIHLMVCLFHFIFFFFFYTRNSWAWPLGHVPDATGICCSSASSRRNVYMAFSYEDGWNMMILNELIKLSWLFARGPRVGLDTKHQSDQLESNLGLLDSMNLLEARYQT